MKNTKKLGVKGAVCALAVGVSLAAFPATASAEEQIGWTGPTPANNGVIYLHNSSINNNDGGLHAKTRMWTSFGNTVEPFFMGVRSRLFKSGVMCEVVNYVYNPARASSVETQTNTNCGTGSYNSHGFVKAFDGSVFNEYVTFPSNPINFTAPAAPAARTAAITESEQQEDTDAAFTVNGESYGLASQEEGVADPDNVAVFADSGAFGYVDTVGINSAEAGTTLAVYDRDGVTEIGGFTIK
jgi:hypothetical protein